MVFAFDGTRPPRWLERRIHRGQAAGVILFSRNVRSRSQVRRMVARLQRIPRPAGLRAPLLVMVDQEGGPVRRIPGSPRRSAAELGAIGSQRAAYGDGRAAARTLRAVGSNVDLAPVVDVARPSSAMERERRAYGRYPLRVARLGRAFARGLRAGRVAATAKHFPGFGAARVNTDDRPVRIGTSLSRLRRGDLPPFRALISDGVPLVMLSTAVYEAIGRAPAALSRRTVTGGLRRLLRFRGVIVTDDLQTPAVRAIGGPGTLAIHAARAGVDIPLFARTYRGGSRAAAALERALRRGALRRGEAERAAARVLALRRRLG